MLDRQASNDTAADSASTHDFDAQWYLDSYPLVSSEIGAGAARDPEEHYRKIGRYRGYLPNYAERRPDNPAAPPSKFGGMWTDHGNALDLLAGKHELGLENDDQAALLSQWIRDGYVIIKNALPPSILDPARADLEAAYRGDLPNVIMECVEQQPRLSTFLPHHATLPTKALDLHWLLPSTRRAIFAPKITDFLESVFERRPMASQTLGFWRGSQQGSHQDSAYVSYSLNMHFCASWIAYEDVQQGAGELLFYPGSQKLPEYLYVDGLKNIVDADRLHPQNVLSQQIAQHVNELPGRAAEAGLTEHTFLGKAGDVLIWSADLAHGGKPISANATRMSMVTHYCPKELTPLFFEQAKREIRFHDEVYPYATSVY